MIGPGELLGAVPGLSAPDESDPGGVLDAVRSRVRRSVRGPPDAVVRILVVGTFGTEAVAQRLGAVLGRRGRENQTVSVGDDRPWRGTRAGEGPLQALIVEATGSGTSVAHARAVAGPPDVVVVTAVGRDDLATLGPGRGDVVRSIASEVPADAHVVNAEGSPAVRDYLETAVERRGATIDHVGEHDTGAPGAELAGAIDGALASLDEPPLPAEERDVLVTASRPEWVELPDGRLYEALGVTDTVAVERLRQALVDGHESVQFVAVLRRDCRDVAAAVAGYAEWGDGRSLVDGLHAVGPPSRLVSRHCAAETVPYPASASADAVLDAALEAGPTIVFGAAEGRPATGFASAIDDRIERSGAVRIG